MEKINKNSKNEESIRRLWDISKSANIKMPEEEEEQGIETLFEKN